MEEYSWENRYMWLINRFRNLEMEQEKLKEQLDEFGDGRSIDVVLGEGFGVKQKTIREKLLEYGDIRDIELYSSRQEEYHHQTRRTTNTTSSSSSSSCPRPPGLYQLAAPYRSVLDAMGHAVFVYNPISGEIRFWNKAAEDLYGYKSFEAVGETFPHLIAETQYYGIGKHIMAGIRCGNSWSGQFPFTKRNGEIFMALVNKTPLYDYGELIGVITVSSDGTAFNLSNNDVDAHADDQNPANLGQPYRSQGPNLRRVQWINPQSSRIASSVSNLASKVRIWTQGDEKDDEEMVHDSQDAVLEKPPNIPYVSNVASEVRIWTQGDDQNDEEMLQYFQDSAIKKPPTNTPVSKVQIWSQEDDNDVALPGSKDAPKPLFRASSLHDRKNEDDLVNTGKNESSFAFPQASKIVSKIQLWTQGSDKNSGEMVDCQRIRSTKLPEMHTKNDRFPGYAFRVGKKVNNAGSSKKSDGSTYDQSSMFAAKVFSKLGIGQQSRDTNQHPPTHSEVPTSFRCRKEKNNVNLAPPVLIHQNHHSQAHTRKSSESLEGRNVQVKYLQNEIPRLTQQVAKKDPDTMKSGEIRWEDLQLKEEIGRGTFAVVYRGIWNGSDVAVKIYFVNQYSEKVLIAQKKEVDIISKLRHPNVLLYMGAVYSEKKIAMATEYLPRGSLFKIIHQSNQALDLKRCLKIAIDIAKGMNYLHHRNPPILHRDLKSSNVLVDRNWNVKVGDFGLSKMKESTFLTARSGLGTPQWMAPEVLRNEPSNEKSDVYSFGVILWEIMTRNIPWNDMNPLQVVGVVGFTDRRLDIPDNISPRISALIHDCWQRNMAARPSFEDIIQTLSNSTSDQL